MSKRDISFSFFFLSFSFFGRNPLNKNIFIGIFETDSAQLNEDTPGIGIIFTSDLIFDSK
jgi:hypothetical protein